MTCQDVNAFLDRAAASGLPPEVLAHAGTCAGCGRLLGILQSQQDGGSVPEGAIRIPDEILNDLKPVRPLPSGPVLLALWLGAAAVVGAIGVALWGMQGWLAQTSFERLLVFGAVLAAIGGSAYGLSVQMAPATPRRFSFFGVEMAALAIFAGTVAVAFHRTYNFALGPENRGCFVRGLVISCIGLVLVLPRMRRGVWLDRVGAALNMGAFISSVCLLVLTLYCPVLNARHVFVGHFGAVAVVMLGSVVASLVWRR
jgi:Negative regulator of sigma F